MSFDFHCVDIPTDGTKAAVVDTAGSAAQIRAVVPRHLQWFLLLFSCSVVSNSLRPHGL